MPARRLLRPSGGQFGRKAAPGLEVTDPRAFRFVGGKRERIPCCLLCSPDAVSQDEQVVCDERWMEVHVRQVRASAPVSHSQNVGRDCGEHVVCCPPQADVV